MALALKETIENRECEENLITKRDVKMKREDITWVPFSLHIILNFVIYTYLRGIIILSLDILTLLLTIQDFSQPFYFLYKY